MRDQFCDAILGNLTTYPPGWINLQKVPSRSVVPSDRRSVGRSPSLPKGIFKLFPRHRRRRGRCRHVCISTRKDGAAVWRSEDGIRKDSYLASFNPTRSFTLHVDIISASNPDQILRRITLYTFAVTLSTYRASEASSSSRVFGRLPSQQPKQSVYHSLRISRANVARGQS